MVKKHKIGLFVNTGTASSPTWKRIKKSTELTIAMNTETEEYDYIADENPTTVIQQYKPAIEQALTMYEDEDDFNYFWDLFYDTVTGKDAETEVMLVFMFDGDNTAGYKAWKCGCTINFENLNAVDSSLNFNINFAGTITKGTATVTGTAPDLTPTFTPSV